MYQAELKLLIYSCTWDCTVQYVLILNALMQFSCFIRRLFSLNIDSSLGIHRVSTFIFSLTLWKIGLHSWWGFKELCFVNYLTLFFTGALLLFNRYYGARWLPEIRPSLYPCKYGITYFLMSLLEILICSPSTLMYFTLPASSKVFRPIQSSM